MNKKEERIFRLRIFQKQTFCPAWDYTAGFTVTAA